jgi:hypothetical protein
MGLASIGLYHIRYEQNRKQKEERVKQIEKCRLLSKEFWDCAARNSTNTECGPEYYKIMKCIEKLR